MSTNDSGSVIAICSIARPRPTKDVKDGEERFLERPRTILICLRLAKVSVKEQRSRDVWGRVGCSVPSMANTSLDDVSVDDICIGKV